MKVVLFTMLLSRTIAFRGVPNHLVNTFARRLKSSSGNFVPFHDLTVSVTASTHEMQGHRPYMEDRIITDFDNKLAAAFDGHGGAAVAATLHQHYQETLKSKYFNATILPDLSNKEVIEGLTQAMNDVDNMVLPDRKMHQVGSTFTLSFIHDNPAPSIITVNVGDSRIVLSQGGKAIDLTVDHKPDTKSEKTRIEKLGGSVRFSGGCARVGGILALSRSIGDRYLKPYVSSDPDVRVHSITPKDEFVIVATDGIWEDFTSQEAVDFIHDIKKRIDFSMQDQELKEQIMKQYPDVTDMNWIKGKLAAELLCHTAIKKGSTDNVSVIIQWLDVKERT